MYVLSKQSIAILLVAISAVCIASIPKSQKTSADAGGAAESVQKPDPLRETILANAKAFMDAFNNHDAAKLGGMFTDNSEVVEENGDVLRGRKKIQAEYAEIFKRNPKGRISLAVDDVRIVDEGIAIEDGRLVTFPDGKNAAYESRYQVVHVNRKGRWLIAQSRTLETSSISHHEHLKELSWMLGDWINEGDNSVVETTCEWSKDGNFLLRKFTVKIAGQPEMNGVQRIGWDPLTGQFKSWVFDSEGGYAQGLWSRVGDNWVVQARGVQQDGTVVTATNQFSYLDKDRLRWVSVHRLAGNEQLPDVSVVMIRKPPKAGK